MARLRVRQRAGEKPVRFLPAATLCRYHCARVFVVSNGIFWATTAARYVHHGGSAQNWQLSERQSRAQRRSYLDLPRIDAMMGDIC